MSLSLSCACVCVCVHSHLHMYMRQRTSEGQRFKLVKLVLSFQNIEPDKTQVFRVGEKHLCSLIHIISPTTWL